MKIKKGLWVSFIGNENTIYKIIEVNKNYILVEGDRTYWERTEYIEYIISFENMKKEKYED